MLRLVETVMEKDVIILRRLCLTLKKRLVVLMQEMFFNS